MHTDASKLTNEYLTHNICLNTTADLGDDGEFIGNPTECAMLNFYEASKAHEDCGNSYKDERNDHEVLFAFPFSSDLKHMTTVSKVDGRIISYVKGSPECVLAMCGISGEERKRPKPQSQMPRKTPCALSPLHTKARRHARLRRRKRAHTNGKQHGF